jgi:hypothetical protein
MNISFTQTAAALALLSLFTCPLQATGADNEELAKAAQNPVANMISVPLQNNINTGIGPDDKTQNILNIQPVYPFSVGKNWNVITRTIIPVISQPDILTGEDRVNGLGDINFTAFFSPAKPGALIWGVGPALIIPSATDEVLGPDRWSAGPSVVALAMPGKWVIGGLMSNVWSFAGSGDKDTSFFTFQYFINYNIANGWYLTSAPIITADWEAESGERWTVPFGGGFGKIMKFGKLPVNGQLSAYYNVESPEYGADWQFRIQLQFLFPK